MMTTPGTGNVANGSAVNVPVHAVQSKSVPQLTRATPGSRTAVVDFATNDSPKIPLERFDVSAELQIGGASVSINASATVSQKGPAFEVDLSMMYFEVVMVSSNGIARQLDLAGDHLVSLSSGEMALIFSPGRRSSGSSYLGAMRQITTELASQLVRPRTPSPVARSDNAAARQTRMDTARQKAIDSAATAQAQAAQAAQPTKKSVEAPVIVKTKRVQAPPVSSKQLVKTVASLASLIKSDSVNHSGKSVSQKYSQPVKNMADSNIVAHTKDHTDGSGQNVMKVLIDDHDVKGKVSIVHSILTDDQGDNRGTLFDQAL